MVCSGQPFPRQTQKNTMSKPLRLSQLLNVIFVFAFLGCSHGTERLSSPEQTIVRGRLVGKSARFVRPDGSPMLVGPDGAPLDGMLIARCVITEVGNVEQCVILQNPFATKNEEFVATFESQKFEPIVFDGKPQRVNFTFRLQSKDAEKYAEDLRKICHVHEMTGKSPELGLQAVAQWLTDNVKTTAARKRLGELPTADIPVWLQALRQDAAAKGISPCPFADTWEEFLKRPPAETETH